MLSRAVRLGTKGQVVLPKEVREKLGLRPGDEVRFRIVNDQVAVVPLRRQAPTELFGVLGGSGTRDLDARAVRPAMAEDAALRHRVERDPHGDD